MLWLIAAAMATCPPAASDVVQFGRNYMPLLVMHEGPMHIAGITPIVITASNDDGFTSSTLAMRVNGNAFRMSRPQDGKDKWWGNGLFDLPPGVSDLGRPTAVRATARLERGTRWLELSTQDHARVLVEGADVQLDLFVTDVPIRVRLVGEGMLLTPECLCDTCLRVDDDALTVKVSQADDPTLVLDAVVGSPEIGSVADVTEVRLPNAASAGCNHPQLPAGCVAWLVVCATRRRQA